MATLFYLPRAVPVSAGSSYASAKLYFFQDGTTTPITTYTTAAMTVAHAHPVVADSSGVFAPIFINEAVNATYKVRLRDEDDVLVYEHDSIPAALTQASLGAVLYPRSAAEVTAGVTPTNYFQPYGNIYRYGNNTSPGVTDMATAFTSALSVSVSHPTVVPQDTFLIGSALTIPATGQVYGSGKASIVKKGFNGDLFTAGAQSDYRDFYVDGNGGTFTGRGFVVSDGSLNETSWRRWTRVSIINMAGHCIEFTQATAGYASMINECRMTTTDQVVEAVKCPDTEANNGNRFMIGCWTFGTPLAHFGGCDNTTLVGCQGAYPTFTADTKKVNMNGCRIVQNGPGSRTEWEIKGTNIAITGCVSGVPEITFNTECFKVTFKGNSIASGTVFTDTSRGVADGNEIEIPHTTYTPTWTASSVNPAIGDGALNGAYERRGSYARVNIKLITGSTSTYGTGHYLFSLPYTAARLSTGSAYLLDTGTTLVTATATIEQGSSNVRIVVDNANYTGTAVPFTWAAGDTLVCDLDYPIT